MPTRPIYPNDTVTTPAANQWFPLVDLNTANLADQNRRMSGDWMRAALRVTVDFSASGATTAPAADTVVAITWVAQSATRIPTDPVWHSHCETGPAAPLDIAIKKVISNTETSVGNVTIGTNGRVSASPSWATVDLAAGDAVIAVITFDGTMDRIGLGFLASAIP